MCSVTWIVYEQFDQMQAYRLSLFVVVYDARLAEFNVNSLTRLNDFVVEVIMLLLFSSRNRIWLSSMIFSLDGLLSFVVEYLVLMAWNHSLKSSWSCDDKADGLINSSEEIDMTQLVIVSHNGQKFSSSCLLRIEW